MYRSIIIIVGFLKFFTFSCNPSVNNSNNSYYDTLRCFKVTQNFPNINVKGKLISNDTMVAWVYYYRDQILYYSSYQYNSDALLYRLLKPDENTKQSTSGSLFLLDSTAIPEIRYRYFVYTKGNSYGSIFDTYKGEYNKRLSVDSVLKKEWTVQSGFDPSVHNSLTLLSSHKDRYAATLMEKYSFRGRKDTGLNGTVELYFSSKLKKGGYSFSPYLDSIKNMKLYRVFMVNNSRHMKNYGITLDRVEEFSELEEVSVKNRDEVLKYFEIDRRNNSKN